ncbi:MAG: hypothetical protein WD928_13430 [Gammaproteobacteria bacterium]
MHQSGTHWLKFMLANALSYQYGIPAPRFNHANDIIGGHKDAVCYPNIPRLQASHSMPHPVMRWEAVHRLLALPHYVVLVRDLRVALASNYAKWRARYGVPFSVYLQGDPSGRRYNSDIWWALRFCNAWGSLVDRLPARVTLVCYESLAAAPRTQLAVVSRAFGLDLDEAALAHGVAVSSKAHMVAKDDPARPPGAVRQIAADPLAMYGPAEQRFVSDVCARYLVHSCGYDYSRW